jgi:hypothetical protein
VFWGTSDAHRDQVQEDHVLDPPGGREWVGFPGCSSLDPSPLYRPDDIVHRRHLLCDFALDRRTSDSQRPVVLELVAEEADPRQRTFQDLGRTAQVHDLVVRAISGHATVEMQQHYSTVAGDEVRVGLAKVISLAGFAKARHTEDGEAGGDAGGVGGGDAGGGSRGD